ncbi:diguanylate cyclase domain-containing protein, partial [Shigella flexneri]|uniref:diguanylate cyclase domain-containing protein n=1 Tax=Shigella flexneri TaxID=623 RepID=UPI0011BF1FEF
ESCARKGDLVFRWGGEEFVLLLPRTPLDTALSLAETIRVSVAKVSISGLPRFTVSIGVAHHEGNESIDELFESCARKGDLVFRWGGEEFVLLLPRTPLDTALSL